MERRLEILNETGQLDRANRDGAVEGEDAIPSVCLDGDEISGSRSACPPTKSSRAIFTSSMAFVGAIQGPPDCDQPGQFCTVRFRPSYLHSDPRYDTRSFHFSLRQGICSSHPGQTSA